MDMHAYISEQPTFSDFGNPSALCWTEHNIALAVDGERTTSFIYRPSTVCALPCPSVALPA